jgi:hypothetical protein
MVNGAVDKDYVEYGLYMKVFMSRYENTQNLTIILDPLIL